MGDCESVLEVHATFSHKKKAGLVSSFVHSPEAAIQQKRSFGCQMFASMHNRISLKRNLMQHNMNFAKLYKT